MLRLAKLSVQYPKSAIAGWTVVGVILVLIGLGVSHALSPSVIVVPGSESSRAQTLTRSQFGPGVLVPILLEGPAAQLDRQGPALVRVLARRSDSRVMSAWDAGDTGASLRPRPTAAMIVVSVARSESSMVKTVQPQIDRTVQAAVSGGVRAHITGQPTLDRALKTEALHATRHSELLALPILFLVLLLVLRAPLAAMLITVFGAFVALGGFGVMALVGKVISTDPVAVALASMAGLALGVGYSMLIVRRFRDEEAPRGAGPAEAAIAATAAVASEGRTILVAGTALIACLVLAVAIAPTVILMSLGIGVVICSALAIGAAVAVMPAWLVLLGHRIEWGAFRAPGGELRVWSAMLEGGNRVTRHAKVFGAVATVALGALAIPLIGLEKGPPDVSQLPASNHARQDFERVATVMGAGWPTPYNLLFVSTKRPITDPAMLRSLERLQVQIARDPAVASVVGPGGFVATSKELGKLPTSLRDSAKLIKGGRRDLGRLEDGLGQTVAGAQKLRSGLGDAAAGAGQLQSGSGSAQAGAAKLHAGLAKAREGAAQVSAGLDSAKAGAFSLQRGSAQALAGAVKLTGALGSAKGPVTQGVPIVKKLAGDVSSSSAAVTRAHEQAQSAAAQLATALAALQALDGSKSDPHYQAALSALNDARGSADSLSGSLGSTASTLGGASAIASAFATQTGELAAGLSALYSGSKELSDGIAKLKQGNAELAGGVKRLSGGGSQLATGVGALQTGAGALEAGLGQLTAGAGTLQQGLASGQAPAGQLAGGLGQLQSGVAKFRSSLPSTKDLEKLQKDSPGLFNSGYFVLAAIAGASDRTQSVAGFAVNLSRGGTAGQIVVIPRLPARTEATQQLGTRLRNMTAAFAAKTDTRAGVGGPAGELADFRSETSSRIALVVIALSAAVALLLMVALRAVLLPLVAVAFNLLTAAATFGVLTLLFRGSDPLLGGPGYLDPMSIIGIFAAVFGISITFQLLLLARTRKAFVESGDADAAIRTGLRHSAAAATGAAAVMLAAVIPFATTAVLPVRQFGIGIAVAALLDALIVRPVLLPAAVKALGPRCWWPTAGAGSRPVVPSATPPRPDATAWTGGARPAIGS